MKEYVCECCDFKTTLLANHTRHLASVKHKSKAILCVDTVPVVGKDMEQSIEMLWDEIDALKLALEECKQLFKIQNVPPPTPTPQSYTPIHVIMPQPPEIIKPVDETCNPRYIEKELNDNPCNDNTPDIHAYFSFKKDHVTFNFDDVEDMVDVDKGYAIDKIVAFVKGNLKKHVEMPFKYIKSSWYIKEKDGWERSDLLNNKTKLSSSCDYSHSIILLKFLFIIQNRFMANFDKLDPEWKRQPETHSTRLLTEVFNPTAYKNSDLLRPLGDLF